MQTRERFKFVGRSQIQESSVGSQRTRYRYRLLVFLGVNLEWCPGMASSSYSSWGELSGRTHYGSVSELEGRLVELGRCSGLNTDGAGVG